MNPTSPHAWERRLIAWIFLAALVLQGSALIRFSQSPDFLPSSDDMRFYSDWGRRIAAGTLSDGRAFYGLPGYAYLLGTVYWLCGFDPFLVGLLQTVAFAAVAAVIFTLTVACVRSSTQFSFRKSTWAGILAAAGWTFFVPAQAFAVVLMPTVLIVLGYWGSILWLSTFKVRRAFEWLAFGTITGLLATCVATILFLIPIALWSAWKSSSPSQPRLKCPGLAAALALFPGVILGTSPAWVHNYIVANEPVFLSAHSGINMWIGNNPVANGYPKIPTGLRASQEGLLQDSVKIAEESAGRPLKRFEVSQFWSAKAKNWISENRFAWMRLILLKFENFWNAFSYDDLTVIKVLRSTGTLLPGLYFGIVATLGIPGLLLLSMNERGRLVLFGVSLHCLALLSVFVTERYRLAAIPGLLIGGAYFVVSVHSLATTRRWRLSALLALLAGGTAVFTTLPRRDPGYWSLDHYKAGIRALDLGEFARAERELGLAYAYTPTSAEINFALGNYHLQSHNVAQAKSYYQVTLALDGNHAGAMNNMGLILLEEKRWEWAAFLLARSLSEEPADAKTSYLLARAYLGAGEVPSARAAIGRALALNPAQPEYQEFRSNLPGGIAPP